MTGPASSQWSTRSTWTCCAANSGLHARTTQAPTSLRGVDPEMCRAAIRALRGEDVDALLAVLGENILFASLWCAWYGTRSTPLIAEAYPVDVMKTLWARRPTATCGSAT